MTLQNWTSAATSPCDLPHSRDVRPRCSRRVDIDGDLFVDAEHHDTRILHAPRDVRDIEVNLRGDCGIFRLEVNGELHGMVLAVDIHHTIHCDRAGSADVQLAADVRGAEGDGRVLTCLEHN